MDTDDREQLIVGLKRSARYIHAKKELESGGSLINEDMAILNLIAQLKFSIISEEHIKRSIIQAQETEKLTKATIELSKETVNSSKNLVTWTRCLAIATFALAAIAFFQLVCR